jgi:hypothetical protein
VCPFGFAFIDVPRGDLNHDGRLTVGQYVQGAAGTVTAGRLDWSNVPEYELFPTDAATGFYAAADQEGHFYAECSNNGECDRALGECRCNAGYTGAACHRGECRSFWQCASVP